jgi:hypothetical protein
MVKAMLEGRYRDGYRLRPRWWLGGGADRSEPE